MSTTTFTLPVRGMTCASCVAHVEQALKSVGGVKDVNVNLATEKASVWFSTDAVGIKDLVEAVRETGYEVPTETVTLPIGGMTCASCVAHVEQALSKVARVVEASVNLATEKATVTFVPGVASLADFKQAVAEAGYEVRDIAEEMETVEDRERAARQQEFQALRLRFIVAAVLGFLTLVGTYQAWFPFLRDVPRQTMWITLFLLTTPVQFWAGWRFYRGAWGAQTQNGRHERAHRRGHQRSLFLQRGGDLCAPDFPPRDGRGLLRHSGGYHRPDPAGSSFGSAGQGPDQRGHP